MGFEELLEEFFGFLLSEAKDVERVALIFGGIRIENAIVEKVLLNAKEEILGCSSDSSAHNVWCLIDYTIIYQHRPQYLTKCIKKITLAVQRG